MRAVNIIKRKEDDVEVVEQTTLCRLIQSYVQCMYSVHTINKHVI